MARSFEFAVLRLAPDPARGEAINLGVVVFLDGKVDIRIGEVVTRAKLPIPKRFPDVLREGVTVLQRLGAIGMSAEIATGLFAMSASSRSGNWAISPPTTMVRRLMRATLRGC